ncbi:hypothetical protein WJM95_31100 [Streptomyces sp. f51]|uniref:hypothetical protein n=1 Tax=Streptomyces sp. f51 TaxID=1827742 RepID=UPI0030D1833A
MSAAQWLPLGSHTITLSSSARVHMYEARILTLGAQELTETEKDFKLSWWPMAEALQAVHDGRFLLPAGPLALLLADHRRADADTRAHRDLPHEADAAVFALLAALPPWAVTEHHTPTGRSSHEPQRPADHQPHALGPAVQYVFGEPIALDSDRRVRPASTPAVDLDLGLWAESISGR